MIYADPPWNHLDEGDTGYPLMNKQEICALPVVEDDAVLLLWTTAGQLPAALEVIAAWGFEFKTSFIWDKEQAGTGVYFRGDYHSRSAAGDVLQRHRVLKRVSFQGELISTDVDAGGIGGLAASKPGNGRCVDNSYTQHYDAYINCICTGEDSYARRCH